MLCQEGCWSLCPSLATQIRHTPGLWCFASCFGSGWLWHFEGHQAAEDWRHFVTPKSKGLSSSYFTVSHWNADITWYNPGSTRAPGAGQECLFPMVQLYHGQGAAQAREVEGGDVRSARNVGEWVKWILSSKYWILNILRLKTCFLLDGADSLIFTKGHVDFTAEVETLVDLNYQTRIWLDKNGSSN
jgi:hypothetical protein